MERMSKKMNKSQTHQMLKPILLDAVADSTENGAILEGQGGRNNPQLSNHG